MLPIPTMRDTQNASYFPFSDFVIISIIAYRKINQISIFEVCCLQLAKMAKINALNAFL